MLKLKAESRDIFGKRLKSFRREGKIPAVVYGKKRESKAVFVFLNEFLKVFKEAGESEIIELDLNGKKENILIYDVQRDPLKDTPIHADFFAVEMDKPIRISAPLEFIGVSEAIKSQGGILVKVIRELEVEALPKDLPHNLNVDISKLKTFEDKIFVSDIILPAGVKITDAKPDEVVALAETPEEEKEEAAAEIDFEKIKVEERGKKKEEGEEENEEK